MNYVAIDPSLTCTALVVNDKKFVFTGNHTARTGKGKLKSWFEEFSDFVTYYTYDMEAPEQSFTESENRKLILYSHIIDDIIGVIVHYTTNLATTTVAIEGYSYSSSAGPLIDLVSFGAILRYRLLQLNLAEIVIVPPQELKVKAASLVYAPVIKGKVTKYVNGAGVAAGSFKKHDMYKCLVEDQTLVTDSWVQRLQIHNDVVVKLKAVPKPIEDVNDAKLLYEWLLRR